jgi:ankyrin repeat protein
MFDKQLPDRPNLEQYKKQAKDLVKEHALGIPDALGRIARHHPRLHKLTQPEIQQTHFSLTDAQLVIAREHGFESWPKFAAHITTLHLIQSVADLKDPVSAFIEHACSPRHSGHNSGTLEHADLILARYPYVATANIYTAAILGDEATVRDHLTRDRKLASATGGTHDWNALTYLCFSRYLRLDRSRSDAFVRTAQTLIGFGASANTGWYEMIDHPNPRPVLESAIYGAAGVAQHPELTRLLLDHGADPNDEETAYHASETYNNDAMKVLVESGKLNADGMTTLLLRKADWHDEEGMRYLLGLGADPNRDTQWKKSAFQHAILRDNSIGVIRLLLDHGADPSVVTKNGISSTELAAHRGRGDILDLFEQRNIPIDLPPLAQLVAACAQNRTDLIDSLARDRPSLVAEVVANGGTLLSEFAGNGNTAGVRNLLNLGVAPSSLTKEGDPYYDVTRDSTALHSAAWRARPETVKLLIERGAPVNALDTKGRTALVLAVKACVDSYWMSRRSPESVEALLDAGATIEGIEIPTGYDEVDTLLRRHAAKI